MVLKALLNFFPFNHQYGQVHEIYVHNRSTGPFFSRKYRKSPCCSTFSKDKNYRGSSKWMILSRYQSTVSQCHKLSYYITEFFSCICSYRCSCRLYTASVQATEQSIALILILIYYLCILISSFHDLSISTCALCIPTTSPTPPPPPPPYPHPAKIWAWNDLWNLKYVLVIKIITSKYNIHRNTMQHLFTILAVKENDIVDILLSLV